MYLIFKFLDPDQFVISIGYGSILKKSKFQKYYQFDSISF